MRVTRLCSLLPILGLTLACDRPDRPAPESLLGIPVFDIQVKENFTAQLNGRNERPDPRATRARGTAVFHLSEDGTALHYKLIVANISNVVQAHIHLGGPEASGGFVVFLYPSSPAGGGRTDGVLATGTITAADFVNALAGEPFSRLIDEIRAGNAYVNVHTNDGVGTGNTGPGDFPGGEVRGQIH